MRVVVDYLGFHARNRDILDGFFLPGKGPCSSLTSSFSLSAPTKTGWHRRQNTIQTSYVPTVCAPSDCGWAGVAPNARLRPHERPPVNQSGRQRHAGRGGTARESKWHFPAPETPVQWSRVPLRRWAAPDRKPPGRRPERPRAGAGAVFATTSCVHLKSTSDPAF